MNEEQLKAIFEEIDLEVELTKAFNLDNPEWTPDYREGFVDGLKRTKELLEDFCPPIEKSYLFTSMDEKTYRSLKRIINGLYEYEKKHYEAWGKGTNHIFLNIERVAGWVDEVNEDYYPI